MSDSEIDELQHFESQQQAELARKAGLDRNNNDSEYDFSDEEVMAIEQSDQEEYYEKDPSAQKQPRGESWGQSRDNYYGGDDYEEDEQGFEEEGEEALRLQKEQAQELAEGDYLDEDEMEGWSKDAAKYETAEPDVPETDFNQMKPSELTSFIEDNYPEVVGLAAELQELEETKKELMASESSLAEFQLTALRSYAGVIHVFFALFCDKARDGPVDLKEHPIMQGLIKARELWRVASLANERDDEDESEEDAEDVEENSQIGDSDAENSGVELDPEAFDDSDSEMLDDSDMEMESNESASEQEEDEFTLKVPTLRKKTAKIDDFNETADTIEEAARAKNRQSLRFYTAQIDKKAGPKKGKEDFGGDMDLPYRERAFERRQRLLKEAQARGQQEQDVLGESDEDNAEEAAHNPVYEKAKQQKQAQKDAKVARHKEALEAAKQGKLEEYLREHPDVDRRAVNYQIQKNKGLTPHRKKENRNARVKKRVRFEAAKKKLGSVRKVHKEQSGPYGGEMSGIRKNLTHSTKFA